MQKDQQSNTIKTTEEYKNKRNGKQIKKRKKKTKEKGKCNGKERKEQEKLHTEIYIEKLPMDERSNVRSLEAKADGVRALTIS